MKNNRKKKIKVLLMLISLTIIFSLSIGAAVAEDSAVTNPSTTIKHNTDTDKTLSHTSPSKQTSQPSDSSSLKQTSSSSNTSKKQTTQTSKAPKTSIPDPFNTRTLISYTTIQAAINDPLTHNGDTIWVEPGTFTENVVVNKQLTLMPWPGMPGTVVVQAANPNSPCFTINSLGSGSTIQGFTIQGATGSYGIYLNGANSCNINGNSITGNRYGIYVNGGTGNTITGNTIAGNTRNGVYISNSSPSITGNMIFINGGLTGSGYDGLYVNNGSPTISGNIIGNNWRNGIYTATGSPIITGNWIANNGVTNTNALTGNGIYVASGNPTIIGNTIENNGNPSNGNSNAANGIYVAGGNVQIQNNPSINGNGHDGIHIAGGTLLIQNNLSINNNRQRGIDVAGGTPTITGNIITGNWRQGIYVNNGTFTIGNNNISNNGNNNGATTKYDGIYVYNGSPTITGNTINNNLLNGIYVYRGTININGNTITSNAQNGVYANGANSTSGATTINGNTITGNLNGIYSRYGTNTIGGSNPSDRNTITNNVQNGIYTANGSPNISGNIIYNNGMTNTAVATGNGIYVASGNPTIIGNTIESNGNPANTNYNAANGIYINGGNAYIGFNPSISSNRRNGIYVNAGSPTILINTISNNGVINTNQRSGNGIYVNNGGTTATPIQITGNNISGNGNPTNNNDNMANGIYITNGTIRIEDNTSINNNHRDGIHIAGGTVAVGSNTAGNTITSNSQQGIHITGGRATIGANGPATINNIIGNGQTGVYISGLTGTNPHTITNNIINSNGVNGVYINGGTSRRAIVTNNEIRTNSQYGIRVSSSNNNPFYGNYLINNNVNARVDGTSSGNSFNQPAPTGGNYWSDYTGTDANGDGFGDTPYLFTGGQDNLPLVPVTITGQTDTPDPVLAGNPLTYTINIRNSGRYQADNVVISDILPSQLQAGTIQYSLNGGPWTPWTGPLNIGSLNSGETAEIRILGTVISSTAAGTILTNTATVNSSTYSGTGRSTIDTTVNTETTLNVHKNGLSIVIAGVNYNGIYTINITNNGPSDAQNVSLTDVLPFNIIGGSYTVNGGTPVAFSGNLLSVNLGTITAGTTVTIILNGEINPSTPAGTVTNTANTHTDTGPTYNFASNPFITTVNTQSTLNVVKEALSQVIAGVTYTNPIYTITITNNGPSDARDVLVQDLIPNQITNREYRVNGGTWTSFTGPLSQLISYIARGASSIIEIRGTIRSSAPTGTITNIATATTYGTTYNSNTTNTTIIKSSEVVMTKVVDKARPNVGDIVTFTVTVRNNGPSDALNIRISDLMPSEFADIRVLSSKGTYDGEIWTLDLANGEEATLILKGRVTSQMAGKTTTNTATRLDMTEEDLNSTVSAKASIYVPKACLYVRVTTNNSNPLVGEIFTMTYKVGNRGPDTATDVIFTFRIPDCMEYVNVAADVGIVTYDPATRTITWNLGDVPVGDPEMFLDLRALYAENNRLQPTMTTTTYDPDLQSNISTININIQNPPSPPNPPRPVNPNVPVILLTGPLTGLTTEQNTTEPPTLAQLETSLLNNTDLWIWILLIVIVAILLLLLYYRRKKTQNKEIE